MAVGDLRYTYEQGSVYLNLSGDNQDLGLPGERRVIRRPRESIYCLSPIAAALRRHTTRQPSRARTPPIGFTHMLAPDIELIVDGGLRRKDEQAQFFFVTFGTYVPTQVPRRRSTPR